MSDLISDLFSGYLIYLLFVVTAFIIIYGGMYLILRPLVLWYFKINTLVSELRENNALLREILDELSNRNTPTPYSHQSKEDYSKYMPR